MKNINKVAIIIDAGYFKQCFKKINKKKPRNPSIKDIEDLIETVLKKVNEKSNLDNEIDLLFRTFYYDCLPYSGDPIKHPDGSMYDFTESKIYEDQTNLINSLKEIDQFAMRLGELSYCGWVIKPLKNGKESKPKPDFRQKGVDMKIGLDMAWLANKKTVDKIVLVAGDSDFISPIKYVRREGVQVYLYPMNSLTKRELREHCDFVLDL